MESTRITLARVLELGVRVSWREATAIVHEAVAATRPTKRTRPATVTAGSCLITRGGDVMLMGTAAQAPPEVVVRLLDDLLASCSNPGRFAGAVADGTALEMLEELAQHIPAKRRRVEVAAVALRGLAAAADAARAMAAAHEPDPAADFDEVITAPEPVASRPASARLWVRTPGPVAASPKIQDRPVALRRDSAVGTAEVPRPGLARENPVAAGKAVREPAAPASALAALAIETSPTQRSRPGVRPWPAASFSVELPSATPQVTAVRTATEVRSGHRSRLEWVKRASYAALVCLVLALGASGVLVPQTPAPQSAVEPLESAVEPPQSAVAAPESAVRPPAPSIGPPRTDAPVGREGPAPLARQDRARLPDFADPPSAPPSVARSAPPASRIADQQAPSSATQASLARPIPLTAATPELPAENTPTVAGAGSPSTTSAAPVTPAPVVANPAAVAPSPAVERPSNVPSPSATAPSPAAAPGSAPAAAPVNAVDRSAVREADARAIENVLGRYRTAFNKMDVGAASAVWPTVNERTLAKAFERLESHDLSFASCKIEIFSVLAEATCSGNARYIPKVGSRTPKDEARRWRFSLRKASNGWLIDSVDAR